MDYAHLNHSLGQFEAAISGEKVNVSLPTVRHLLLALDGSNQDATALAFAGTLARRFSAQVTVTAGADGADADEVARGLAERAAGELNAQPYAVKTGVAFKSAPVPAQRILALQQSAGADLIIVPAPYLRDVGLLGDESLSSPIDMLLAESTTPLLLIRHHVDDVAACLRRAVIPMSTFFPSLAAAAGWAVALAGDGQIDLYAVADEVALREARALIESDRSTEQVTEAAVLRAEQRLIGGLNAALQRAAHGRPTKVNADVAVGDALRLTLNRVHASPCVVCTSAPRERTSAAYHRVQDLILGSRYPVLFARNT